MNIIAQKIAYRRKELGMTQRELAEKLNVSDKTLSRWETGKQIPDALTIPEIANALHMTIPEIYGMEQAEDYSSYSSMKSQESIDYKRISTYKITSATSVVLFALGYGIFSHTSAYWNYMKVGAMVLLFIALLVFLAAELSFEEFYQRTSHPDIYKEQHMRWFGCIIPVTGLFIGIIIPVFKAPVTTIFNGWDVVLPLVVFQSMVLILCIKRELQAKKLEIKTSKMTGVYILTIIGILCSIGFIVSVLSNPYQSLGGFEYDWQANAIWKKLKAIELSAGVAFFCMNLLYAKEILGIFENFFRKIIKFACVGIAGIAALTAIIIGVANYNLQSKVTYTIKEVPMYKLTHFDHSIVNWINECNLTGYEINHLSSYRYDPETGDDIKCYLIYMPHGYKNTEFKVRYQLGLSGKVLKLDIKNTTPIMDDNYYLCYMEVINNRESFEIQTYLDGELQTYIDEDRVYSIEQEYSSAVRMYRALLEHGID